MRFLPLLLAGLGRRKIRTVLTLLSVLVAFVLYGYLGAIEQAFSMGVDVAGADRLVVRHKVSIIQMLPISYEEEIERIPGVVEAAYATWFGGVYQEPRNFFPQIPVDPDEYLTVFSEFLLDDDERAAWAATRTGAVAGRATADRFGWKVGDRIPIQATIWQAKDGGQTWEFDLVGIYEGAEQGTDTTQFLFRYDYFDENRAFGQGQIGWYHVAVDDAEHSAEVAAAIDQEFSNSPAETTTETEGAFVQAFAKQVGDVGKIMVAILTAVFFTILLVAGNTMAQAVRERTTELGVLKALGFSDRAVLALVLAESLLLSGLGGGLGLGIASALISRGDPTGGALPIFYLPPSDLAVGVLLVLALGLTTGLLPALQAMRLDVASALRRS